MTAATPARLAVIGLGAMGLKHARCIAAHPDAVLTAVMDLDPARAATALDCAVVTDVSDLIGRIDGAIIAVPTAVHAVMAAPLLQAGIACLVEKPFVATTAEGTQLEEAARNGNAALTVGYIERFNPAIEALTAQLPDPTTIRAIAARRISGASARVLDIDVVLDLMVHDLDVVLSLKRQSVTTVAAAGNADHAHALLTFADSSVASLTASRIAPGRIRDLDVIAVDRVLHADYIARTVSENRNENDAVVTRQHSVAATDALTAQLNAFLNALRGASPVVSAHDAMTVMDIAWRIQRAMGLTTGSTPA